MERRHGRALPWLAYIASSVCIYNVQWNLRDRDNLYTMDEPYVPDWLYYITNTFSTSEIQTTSKLWTQTKRMPCKLYKIISENRYWNCIVEFLITQSHLGSLSMGRFWTWLHKVADFTSASHTVPLNRLNIRIEKCGFLVLTSQLSHSHLITLAALLWYELHKNVTLITAECSNLAWMADSKLFWWVAVVTKIPCTWCHWCCLAM